MATGTETAATDAPSRRRRFKPISILYVVMGLAAAGVLAFNIFRPVIVLPRIRLAPGYSMTNQQGQRVTSDDLRGSLALYSFTYTRCQAPACPQTAADLRALRARLARADLSGIPFALVTITVDPEYDTPEALAAFAESYQDAALDESIAWHFLRGDPDRTKLVVGGGFGVYYGAEDGADAPITLEPRHVLVDGWGIIRAEYRDTWLDVDRVLDDVEFLIDETRNSAGAARVAYEAAHLFRCYP